TCTLTESSATHPLAVSTSRKYLVETVGLTMGFELVLVEELTLLVHKKVDPLGPVGLPPRSIASPRQIVVSLATLIKGRGLMFTCTVSVAMHKVPVVDTTT